MQVRGFATKINRRIDELAPSEALNLRQDLATLAETARVCRRTKWPSTTKIVRPKRRSTRERRTWCQRCNRAWPHTTRPEWSWHMYALWLRKGPRVLHARGHYSSENARTYGLASGRARYRRAIERRSLLVKQITPHV